MNCNYTLAESTASSSSTYQEHVAWHIPTAVSVLGWDQAPRMPPVGLDVLPCQGTKVSAYSWSCLWFVHLPTCSLVACVVSSMANTVRFIYGAQHLVSLFTRQVSW